MKALGKEVIDIGTGGDPEHKRNVSSAERVGYGAGTLLSGKFIAKAVSAAVKVGGAAKAAAASKALAIANQARKLTRQAKAAMATVGPKLNQCVTTIKRVTKSGVDFAKRIQVRMPSLGQTNMSLFGVVPPKISLKPKAGGSGPILFGQKRIAPHFRDIGSDAPDYIKGRLIEDVANDLKTGKIKPEQIRVEYFVDEQGRRIADNNRGLAALRMAGYEPVNIREIPKHPAHTRRLTEPAIDRNHRIPGKRVAVTINKDGSDHLYSIFFR